MVLRNAFSVTVSGARPAVPQVRRQDTTSEVVELIRIDEAFSQQLPFWEMARRIVFASAFHFAAELELGASDTRLP